MSGGDRKEGLASAVGQTGAGELDALRSVQGDLFEPAMMAPRHRAEALAGDEERGVGRPKGAKGRRSQEWVDYLSSRYTMPLESLVALGAMSPAELFRELRDQATDLIAELRADGKWVIADTSAPVDEAAMIGMLTSLLKVQVAAWKEAAPYLHEKRGAVIDDGNGNDLPVMALGVLTRPGGSDFQGRPAAGGMDLRPKDVRAQNQEVSEGDGGKSTDGKSTADAKPLNDMDDEA
jgi:hypothetical protein